MNDSVLRDPSPASGNSLAFFRNLRERAARLALLPRAAQLISALERPAVLHDLTPRRLTLAAAIVYFAIGFVIERTGAFNGNDFFFNGDCGRIFADDFHPAHGTGASMGLGGHPFVPILVGPLVAAMELLLQGTGDLAGRFLCHAAAALAVGLGYRVLRAFGASRWFATWGGFVYGASCSQLVLGSIIETYELVALAITASLLVAARSDRVIGNALLSVVPFGLHMAVAPHALLMPPVLWFGRMRFSRWLGTVVMFLCLVALFVVAVAKIQDAVYPGLGSLLQNDVTVQYGGWWAMPKTRAAVLHRVVRLVPHFFAFNVVAPYPLYSDDSRKLTTFMLESKDLVAHYDTFGVCLATVWVALSLVATVNNVRTFFRGDAAMRARVVLLLGWVFGAFGFFMAFGDDLLLYSPLWTFHGIAWVVLGLSPLVSGGGLRERWARVSAFVFAGALAVNNAIFVARMVSRY